MRQSDNFIERDNITFEEIDGRDTFHPHTLDRFQQNHQVLYQHMGNGELSMTVATVSDPIQISMSRRTLV